MRDRNIDRVSQFVEADLFRAEVTAPPSAAFTWIIEWTITFFMISRTTVSRICRELRHRYRAFRNKTLAEINVLALFLDAVYLPTRPSGDKEGVLVVSGYTTDGKRVLLAVRLGQRESHLDWLDLGRDLTRRGRFSLAYTRRSRNSTGRRWTRPPIRPRPSSDCVAWWPVGATLPQCCRLPGGRPARDGRLRSSSSNAEPAFALRWNRSAT